MWKYIELAAGVSVITAITFIRLNSGKFFLAIDAILMFFAMALIIGFTTEDLLGPVAGWGSAIVYLVAVASVIFVSMKRKQEANRKRAWKSWVKGGRYD